jgi:transcriptional regulator
MYLPPLFREDALEAQHELIRAYPFGLLITGGAAGLIANPVPFVLYPEGEKGTLRVHLARANPHWRELQTVEECLVVFQGPQGYITPSWYATKRETGKVVPTWNFANVHVWGKPTVTEDAAWLRRQVDDLTIASEGRRAEPWAVDDAPEDFVRAQMRGIVGVEIPISRIEGKWKASQNRPVADRLGVIAGLREEQGPDDPMAAMVAARNGLT